MLLLRRVMTVGFARAYGWPDTTLEGALMRSRKATGRLVGVLYLLLGIPNALSLNHFPRRFLIPNDPVTTAANIESGAMLFRLWAFLDVIAGVVSIWMAIELYRLLKDVHRDWARFLVGVVFVMAAMSFAITIIQLAPLTILNGSSTWAPFDRAQLESLAYGFITLRGQAVGAISVYWGVWLVPLAVLIYRSGFLPKLLGIVLGLAAGGYLVSAVVFFVAPDSYRTVFWATAPIYGIGEISFLLYMLIKGARTEED